MIITKSGMEKLTKEIHALITEHRQLIDYDEPSRPGPPASEEQIRAVESAFHCNLPASYRLFLSIHNGWQHWSGDVALLSTEQMLAGEYAERINEWRAEMREYDPVLIDKSLVIGFSLFVGEQVLVDLFSPGQHIVIWDNGEIKRRGDFGDYLQGKKKILLELVAEEKQS